MSLEKDPRRIRDVDLERLARGQDAADHPATLKSLLDHLETVQGQLDDVTAQLNHLQQQDAILREGLARFNRQMARARQLQHDLLPRSLPQCASLKISRLYLPAKELSGDMYEVVRLNDHQLSITVSDATGHDMAAAMLSIFMKSRLRSGLRVQESVPNEALWDWPNDLLRKLNHELLAADLSECHFLTLIHAIYDELDHCLLWSRGGMPYPILIRPGHRPQQIVSEGGIIGAFERQQYDLVSTHLGANDLMLLFTDGLEALLLNSDVRRDRPRKLLETIWCQTLTPDTLQPHLQDVEELVRSTPQDDWPVDDITILALEGTSAD